MTCRALKFLPLLALSLAGCATIIEGTNEEIMVNTNPSGGSCGLYRQGVKIAEVTNTPGSALIKKTKYDVTILCVKEGYQQATFLDHSGAAGATAGNIILGGGIGWAIDSASGSDNKYDSPVNITFVPDHPVATIVVAPTGPTPHLPDALPGSVPAT